MMEHAEPRRTGGDLLALAVVTGCAVMLHLAAWRSGSRVEHFGLLAEQFTRFDTGQSWILPRAGTGLAVGGGAGYFRLLYAVRQLGLDFPALQWLQLGLDLATLTLWLRLLRQEISSVCWIASGAGLVAIPFAKHHLVENSVFAGWTGAALFACLLTGIRRRSPWCLTASAVALGITLHLSLTGLVVVPVLVGLLAWEAWRGDRRLAGLTAVLLACGAVAGLWAVRGALVAQLTSVWGSAAELIEASGGDGAGTASHLHQLPLAFLANPLVLVGVAVAIRGQADLASKLHQRFALAWYLVGAAGVTAMVLAGVNDAYHFAIVAPAWALLLGLGLARLLQLLAAPLPTSASPARLLAVGLGGWLIWSVAAAVTPPPQPDLAREACQSLRRGACGGRLIHDLLDGLEEQGVLVPERDVRFHGAWANCLAGGRRWRRPAGGAPRDLLLVGAAAAEGTPLLRSPGAVRVGDVLALPGVRPVDRQDGHGGLSVPPADGAVLYLEFHGGEVTPDRAARDPRLFGGTCFDEPAPDPRDDQSLGWTLLSAGEAEGARGVTGLVGEDDLQDILVVPVGPAE